MGKSVPKMGSKWPENRKKRARFWGKMSSSRQKGKKSVRTWENSAKIGFIEGSIRQKRQENGKKKARFRQKKWGHLAAIQSIVIILMP